MRMTRAAVRIAKFARRWSCVIIAEDAGRVVGVLNAVDWPHCQLGPLEKLKIALAVIPSMRAALWRQLKISNAWSARDPRRPHRHLGPIAVHPDWQGRGVGSAMLSSFLASVDAQRMPVYLETDVDRNVALYQKFGFTVIARQTILGVDNRFMWREPQADSHR